MLKSVVTMAVRTYPLLAAFLLSAGLAPPQTPLIRHDLTESGPETVGFSSQRLDRLHSTLRKMIDDRVVPGMVTMLARHGKIVDVHTYGTRELGGAAPMARDAIFRIHSMTKPLTGVAMMILYEQGKWLPSDPIAKFIPEFANLRVYKGDANGDVQTEAPKHRPTMAELMSHTAGFTYGSFGDTPVDRMYRKVEPFVSSNLHEMIVKLAGLPLLYQPGEEWVYSASVDIQGYIVEKISGKPLGAFIRENILDPLGMKDTGFHVDPAKMNRFVPVYKMTLQGSLAEVPPDAMSRDYVKEPGMPSGGGGMVSTASDYLRFAQMLLEGGQLDGVRILAPASVAMMRANRLPDAIRNSDQYGISFFRVRPGAGFGFDFAVYDEPFLVSHPVGKGTYFWFGAGGTWFWIDPTNDIVFVGMVQRMLEATSPDLNFISQALVYQALVNPEK